MHGTVKYAVVVTSVLAGAALAAGPAQGAWRAARPAPGAVRVRLAAATEPGDPRVPAARAKVYYLLHPGEELVCAVTGSGEMRVKARPVRDSVDAPETFRYAVGIGTGRERRFRRRSSPDRVFAEVGGGGGSVALDAEDSVALQIPEGTGTVRVRMDAADGRSAYVRVLLGEGLTQPRAPRAARSRAGLLGSPDLRGKARVGGVGYDSNAYLTPTSVDSAEGQAYWPVRLGLDYAPVRGRTFRFRADWKFDGRFYRDSVLQETRHTFDMEQRWRPSGSARGATWMLEEQLRTQNDTFVARGERDEFETSSSGQTVPFGDRFDSWDFRIRPRGWVPLGERFTLAGQASFRRRDYRRDFEEFADIYSLDRSEWGGSLDLEWARGPWTLVGTAGGRWTDYDEKFSRNINGITLPGEPALYLDRRAGIDARVRGRSGFGASAGFTVTRRDDLFAGYWDRTVYDVETEVERRWRGGHRVALRVSRSDTSYDRARVGYSPTGAIREKDRTRFGFDGTYRLHPAFDLLFTWTYEDANNNTTVFDYERILVEAGLSARI